MKIHGILNTHLSIRWLFPAFHQRFQFFEGFYRMRTGFSMAQIVPHAFCLDRICRSKRRQRGKLRFIYRCFCQHCKPTRMFPEKICQVMRECFCRTYQLCCGPKLLQQCKKCKAVPRRIVLNRSRQIGELKAPLLPASVSRRSNVPAVRVPVPLRNYPLHACGIKIYGNSFGIITDTDRKHPWQGVKFPFNRLYIVLVAYLFQSKIGTCF